MESLSPEVIANSLGSGLFIIDESLNVSFWNDWLVLKTGISSQEIVGKNIISVIPYIDESTLKRKIKTTLLLGTKTFYNSMSKKQFLVIKRFNITDNLVNRMYLNVVISRYLPDEDKVIVSINDVSEMRDLQVALKRQVDTVRGLHAELQRDHNILEENLMIVKTDTNGNILQISEAMSKIFGYMPEELIGKKTSTYRDNSMPSSLFIGMWGVISHGRIWRGEVKNKYKDGSSHWLEVMIIPIIEEGKIVHFIAIYNDIQDKKKLETLAMTDPLTQLHNRNYFDRKFNEMVEANRRDYDYFSFVIMDIDHFKLVNDTYGHQIGDKILQEVASLMSRVLRDSDIIARWGGEEFVILLHASFDLSKDITEKLRAHIEASEVEGLPKITCSFGLTDYRDGDTMDAMIKRADELLYKAKDNGRNRVEF